MSQWYRFNLLTQAALYEIFKFIDMYIYESKNKKQEIFSNLNKLNNLLVDICKLAIIYK